MHCWQRASLAHAIRRWWEKGMKCMLCPISPACRAGTSLCSAPCRTATSLRHPAAGRPPAAAQKPLRRRVRGAMGCTELPGLAVPTMSVCEASAARCLSERASSGAQQHASPHQPSFADSPAIALLQQHLNFFLHKRLKVRQADRAMLSKRFATLQFPVLPTRKAQSP